MVLLCLSAGCNSHPKQEAGDQSARSSGAAASNDPPSQKTVAANSARQTAIESWPDEPGFKHTVEPEPKPRATPASATVVQPVVQPAVHPAVQPSVKDDRYADDRYAEAAPAPAIGNRPAVLPTDPPGFHPKPAARTPDPHSQASQAIEEQPAGNPLRDPRASKDPGRPKDPAQSAPPSPAPLSAPAGPSLDNKPSLPATQPSQPGPRSELVIQTKPDETSLTLPAGPIVGPVAGTADKKPQPKEHGPAPGGWVGPNTAKNSGVPFDPIKVNGPIFVDWPTPKLALVITGNQEGYLEPCGCAGLDRMKGGMSRRYTLFRELRKKGWPLVGLDAGNIAKGFGKQSELKFQIAVNAMNEMKYSAVTLGPTDLHLPTDYVMSLTIPAAPGQKTMFVAGNVGLFTFDESLLPRTQLINAGFKTIGVTAVLGKTYSAQLAANPNLKIISPEQLLNQAMPMLKGRANYLVLLAQSTRQEAIDLANQYPDFDLVICSDHFAAGTEPPDKAEQIGKGKTKLVVVGEKGMYAVVLGMYDDPRQPMRYQRVKLDSRFASSPEMVALMAAYQDQLKELGLSGLGIRPLDHPLKDGNGDFTGSEACKSCHEESYRVWKKSPHSRAFATLKNVVPPRNFDPECVSCHTVGWNPAEFFPYKSGYLSEKETPKLINVGCEDCHGPGQKHVRAENQGTPAEQALYRKAVVVTKEEMADPNSWDRKKKQDCWSCHDLDNSPEFKFDLYWPFVKHYEKQ